MKVLVIGCGIGGMAAAAALARDGHSVSIAERFDAPRPVGAGLLLQPSGLDALDRLGFGEAAQTIGAPVRRLIGHTPRGRKVLDLRYEDGRPGDEGRGVHRAALFNLLHAGAMEAGVELITGADIVSVDHPERPVVLTRAGERLGPFDLVLIADGAHSLLRHQLCPQARAPIYPWGAVWTVLRDPGGTWSARQDLAQIYEGCEIMIGVLPIGPDPADPEPGPHVNFFWSLKREEFAAWRAAGLEAFKARVTACWPEIAPMLEQLDSLDPLVEAEYRDVRVPRWTQGRIALLGDAAHGTSPQLGQGANLALGDAAALVAAIQAEADVETALQHYARARKPVARFYSWASWALTPVFQSSSTLIAGLRDALFGLTCRLQVVKNIMAWILTGRGRWLW